MIKDETSSNVVLKEFTYLARKISIATGINLDLNISFDFINSDDSISAYSAIIDQLIEEDEVILVAAATWKEFIDELNKFIENLDYDTFQL